jgi:hypothetical protein
MLVGFAASSRTLRQAPQTLYKTVSSNLEKKMKFILTILILITSNSYGQNNMTGIYSYSTEHFSETLQLNANYTFKYNLRMHFIRQEIIGNYLVVGDSLVLNSFPQRDKIIVIENLKGNFRNKEFHVNHKDGHPFNYQLYLITESNDTVISKNQNSKTKIKIDELKSFYIIDTKGLKSPTYFLKGTNTNYFDVQFENIRVFESEKWIIDKKLEKIIPLGMDNEYQNYYLAK